MLPILNYSTPRKPPPRNWFWPLLLAVIILGAMVLVTSLQLHRMFEGMEEVP